MVTGLGMAAPAPRMLPLGAVEMGARSGLPVLPRLPVVLHSRVRGGQGKATLGASVAVFTKVVHCWIFTLNDV